ncbi:DUF3291 domain-containing protein [Ahrensia sp. R2A130]|uniref:DUF3291 domain-containing protein n=1 Tax=Ahrensia sp. R2A130 TaxID=744979 RepID=UPI0001E0940B|nr:DUF3291 domain-containing protein [Ahrensia sp. R2A130]EFL89994.1 conserved hypothetical protein [Ahrensia sp. R2A130]
MSFIAQLNIAKPRYANDDPRFAGFMDNLNRINNLGASMPGFVWINADDSGHAMDLPTPWPDEAANLTVWESAKALEHFVWNTVHKKFYNRKAEWFDEMKSNHFVMWWVEVGHRPTLHEAKDRLDHLNAHGNSDHAFGWSHLPHVKLWQQKQCG